ncbi:MAG: DUF2807 domain-containing protein [Spirochaetales bacterium]|nr:MAG: DUF2807 domain-containing protein [Spirochaetales bacterium]
MRNRFVNALFCSMFLLGAACFSASASGTQESGVRSVHNFSGVSLETSGNLFLVQGDEESLTIDAPSNIITRISTEVRGGTLYIKYRGWMGSFNASPTYYLSMKTIEKLAASNSGNIEAKDIIADDIDLTASSSGHIRIGSLTARQLKTGASSSGGISIANGLITSLEAVVSSSGNIDIAGMVKNLRVTSSSSGVFTGDSLKSSKAAVAISSSGRATIWVIDELEAAASSSGRLSYYGDPEVSSMTTSSSGEINPLGAK